MTVMDRNRKRSTSLGWLYSVPGGKRNYVWLLAFLEALNGASGVLYALVLRGVVDGAVKGDRTAFLRGAIWLVALVACQLLLRAMLRHFYEKSKADLENAFKSRLFSALLDKDYGAVSALHSGEWMNRLTNDTKLVADAYVTVIPGLIGMLVKLVSAMILMLALDARFALILMPLGLIMGGIAWLIRGRLKGLHRNIQEKDGRLRSFLQDRLGGMMLLRAFSVGEKTKQEAAEYMEVHKDARMRRERFSNLTNVGLGVVVQGMYVFAVIWFGYGILEGQVSYGTLTAMTQLITQVQAPITGFSAYLPRWYAMLASAERLMEAEAFEDELLTSPRPLEEELVYYHNELKSLSFDQVSFSYPDLEDRSGGDALRNASLGVNKGEILAFTGPSGCGKSTMLKLLLCVYHPQKGGIFLEDEQGGRTPLTAERRRLFAYVPQGNLLLHGSIREAVCFGAPNHAAEDSRIWEALEIACAADFVRQQEQGLDTVLGERGSGLSEGQLQRLAIARAIFAGNPVLLLDEATASLDEETEKKLLKNIKNLTDKTLLIVTHRPAALSICDRVVHFSEGGIEP